MNETLFTFAHVTDAHLLYVPDMRKQWGQCVDAVSPLVESLNAERYHPLPDFVVFGGDNVNGGWNAPFDHGVVCEKETRWLKSILDDLKVPYYLIIHGHDTWGEHEDGMLMLYGRIDAIPPGHDQEGLALGNAARKYFGDKCLLHTEQLPGGFVGIFMSEVYMEQGEFVTIGRRLGWLEEQLDKAQGKHVLFFYHVPLVWPRRPEPHMQFPKGDEPWNFSAAHPAIRSLLGRHGNVIAQYAGHLHINGLRVVDGIHYVTTSGLTTYPGEYRLVTVKRDTIEHRCVRLPTGLAEGRKDATDIEHPTVDVFNEGLPAERDFVIHYRR